MPAGNAIKNHSVLFFGISIFSKRLITNIVMPPADKVLKTIEQIFTSQTRETVFVSCYGGEECMGISPNRAQQCPWIGQ